MTIGLYMAAAVTGGNLNSGDAFDGGDGTDTITFGAFTADTDIDISNFTAGSGADHDTLDLSAFGLDAGDLAFDVSGADAIIEFDNADGDTMEISHVGRRGETASDILNFNITLYSAKC